jgi:hypothetical protein
MARENIIISILNGIKCPICGEGYLTIQTTVDSFGLDFPKIICNHCHKNFVIIYKEDPFEIVNIIEDQNFKGDEIIEDSIKKAIDILVREFKKDKSNGSYYHSWQSNIACAIMDTMPDVENIHGLANEAARKFLDILIGEEGK